MCSALWFYCSVRAHVLRVDCWVVCKSYPLRFDVACCDGSESELNDLSFLRKIKQINAFHIILEKKIARNEGLLSQ